LHKNLNNLIIIQNSVKAKFNNIKNLAKYPEIIAVSKTFPISEILPLINYGHHHFGENKIQEAIEKWSDIKNDFKKIKLHMIGNLQTNKVKYVIPLFDYIHSLDSLKLAEKISNEQIKINKKLKIFIQVNIGNETQKSGINIEELEIFYDKCKREFGLDIIGLMCLPPRNYKSSNYFNLMKKLNEKIQLSELSMGMSEDFLDAIDQGSTFLRIGSKIFGKRS
jgi:pyridoxal phosphate enzyme (YggS family)